MNRLRAAVGRRLARYLAQPRHVNGTSAPADLGRLQACLRPDDVVLVEGNSRVSTAINYLTQSTWSLAALYVGPRPTLGLSAGAPNCLVEADTVDGVRAVGLAALAGLQVRVCRLASLSTQDAERVACYTKVRIGDADDLLNVFDLARYMLPTPPVPLRWRRHLLVMGSGDPTRAICSTLMVQVFESVRYPILPLVEQRPRGDPLCPACVDEVLHVRHHSLFVPRDFDVSPYFVVVKPTLFDSFEHETRRWHSDD